MRLFKSISTSPRAETEYDRIEICPKRLSYSARSQGSMKAHFPGAVSLNFNNNRNTSERSQGTMYPLDDVQRTTDRIKQKTQTEVDTYQHQGKVSICTSRCLSATNLSVWVKEKQKSEVFTADWGLPIVPYLWKSIEKTWKWGIKSTPQQGEGRRQPCYEILIKGNCPAPTECVSLGVSWWEEMQGGAEAALGPVWVRKAPVGQG